MNKKTAMQILGLKILTLAALKTQRAKAASKFHPDKVGISGLETMKSINVAYDFLKDLIDRFGDDTEAFEDSEENDSESFSDDLQTAINAIIGLDGLILEVCGNWIWVSGDTRPHKEAIKAAGYFWASKKMMWYWRPAEYKSKNRKNCDMDKIRSLHGSKEVKPKSYKAIK
jgi:curved DNA-binding protein CbpA